MNNNKINIVDDNNKSLFKFKFSNVIQQNLKLKFNYNQFLTKNHDTHKFRSSLHIETLCNNEDNSRLYQLGRMYKEDIYWVLYIPRIVNINIDEDIYSNEIYNRFFKNLQKDIDTPNINNVYLVLTNIYESIAKEYIKNDRTLNFTFYKLLLNKKHILSNTLNPEIYPTFCKLNKLISKSNSNCNNDNVKLLFLSFLSNDFQKFTSLYNYNLCNSFLNYFATYIIKGYFDKIIDVYTFYSDNKNNDCFYKIDNDLFYKGCNLVNRCKIDNNSSFLYSNLSREFYEIILKPFIEGDKVTLKILLAPFKYE